MIRKQPEEEKSFSFKPRVCYKAFLAAGRAIAVAVVVVFKGQGSEHVLKAPQIACSTQ